MKKIANFFFVIGCLFQPIQVKIKRYRTSWVIYTNKYASNCDIFCFHLDWLKQTTNDKFFSILYMTKKKLAIFFNNSSLRFHD